MENNVVYDAVEGVKLKADELLSDCESIGGGGIDNVQSGVTELLSRGAVKSIQKGSAEATSANIGSGGRGSVSIPISAVQVNNAVLLHNFGATSQKDYFGSGEGGSGKIISVELTGTQINVGLKTGMSSYNVLVVYGDWTVIEFY